MKKVLFVFVTVLFLITATQQVKAMEVGRNGVNVIDALGAVEQPIAYAAELAVAHYYRSRNIEQYVLKLHNNKYKIFFVNKTTGKRLGYITVTFTDKQAFNNLLFLSHLFNVKCHPGLSYAAYKLPVRVDSIRLKGVNLYKIKEIAKIYAQKINEFIRLEKLRHVKPYTPNFFMYIATETYLKYRITVSQIERCFKNENSRTMLSDNNVLRLSGVLMALPGVYTYKWYYADVKPANVTVDDPDNLRPRFTIFLNDSDTKMSCLAGKRYMRYLRADTMTFLKNTEGMTLRKAWEQTRGYAGFIFVRNLAKQYSLIPASAISDMLGGAVDNKLLNFQISFMNVNYLHSLSSVATQYAQLKNLQKQLQKQRVVSYSLISNLVSYIAWNLRVRAKELRYSLPVGASKIIAISYLSFLYDTQENLAMLKVLNGFYNHKLILKPISASEKYMIYFYFLKLPYL